MKKIRRNIWSEYYTWHYTTFKYHPNRNSVIDIKSLNLSGTYKQLMENVYSILIDGDFDDYLDFVYRKWAACKSRFRFANWVCSPNLVQMYLEGVAANKHKKEPIQQLKDLRSDHSKVGYAKDSVFDPGSIDG